MIAAGARYRLTLTGAPDGTSDLVLAPSSIQASLRKNTVSFLTAVVSADVLADLIARPNGVLILEKATVGTNGIGAYVEIAQFNFSDFRSDYGPRSASLTVTGTKTLTTYFGAGTSVALQDVAEAYRLATGQQVLACSPINMVNPGDSAIYDGSAYTIETVELLANGSKNSMTLTEA